MYLLLGFQPAGLHVNAVQATAEFAKDGADYRGVQTRTKNGYQCEQWGQGYTMLEQRCHTHRTQCPPGPLNLHRASGNAAAYNSSTYPNSGALGSRPVIKWL